MPRMWSTSPRFCTSLCFFFSSRRRHTRFDCDWSSDVCSSDLRHGVQCWLVNTGWTGGPYGAGQRMRLAHTRAMVRAALAGTLDRIPTTPDPVFGLEVPLQVPGVPGEMLLPRGTWSDPAGYDAQATRLARMFRENFEQFQDQVHHAVREAGPRA